MISKTEQVRLVILAKPGMCAGDVMRACPGIKATDGYGVYLHNLFLRGEVSRAKAGGKKFRYWPPGAAPIDPPTPETPPAIAISEEIKRGIDRVEAATSDDRSAGVGHATGAALRPTSGRKKRGPQHASPITRSPAEAMKAGGRSSAGPSPGNIQSGRPTAIITPDWVLYPIDGGLVIVNKESNAGIRLDVETVCAIAGLVAAA